MGKSISLEEVGDALSRAVGHRHETTALETTIVGVIKKRPEEQRESTAAATAAAVNFSNFAP